MLIKNARIATWDDHAGLIENGWIHIQGSIIASFGAGLPPEEVSDPESIDAGGALVMPANICAHTHFYSAFSRGMPIPGPAPKGFIDILQKLWWPLDQALTLDASRASAQLSLIGAIRGGTSLLFDHHASQRHIRGSLESIAGVVVEAGLRACLSYEVSDRLGDSVRDEGIAENAAFLQLVQSGAYDAQRISGLFGLHASLTLSEGTLERCRAAAPHNAGFHFHLAEGEADQSDSMSRYGERVTNRFNRHGMLGQRSVAAHGVHLDDAEIAVLASSGTRVTHQPRSNMNNAVGLPAVQRMLDAGVKVCVGNDGFSNTMWDEWKTIYLAHKHENGNPQAMDAAKIIQMAVVNNRDLVAILFDGLQTGVIATGAAADLMIVDYEPFTALTAGNLPWQIIFGFEQGMIRSLMVGGQWVMRDRELLTIDEERVIRESFGLSKTVWTQYVWELENTVYARY